MATQRITDRIYSQQGFLLWEWLTSISAVVALIVWIVDHGFYLAPPLKPWMAALYEILSGLFLLSAVFQLILHPQTWIYLRNHLIRYILSLFMLFETILVLTHLWSTQTELPHIHIVLLQMYILSNIGRKFIAFSQYIARFSASPAKVIVVSFAGVILAGSWLLMLPKATTTPIRYIDAFFTSTSAVCVTGLIVVDTATAYTRFGQLIVLGLIQVGGLGIMTITAFFSLLIGQRMSGREQVLLGDAMSTERYSQLGKVIHSALLTTLIAEACGCFILFLRWRSEFAPGLALYTAFFHSISAFCNAGFSTFSSSLMNYAADITINLTICGLIILGGLGFETHRNIQSFIVVTLARKKSFRFSLQTKIVLIVTAILLLTGMFSFWALERNHDVLRPYSFGHQMLISFFQSVTPRTAGFNTIDYGKLQPATLMTQIFLMFIGVGPGSTGGGIKVTTLAILVMTVIFAARGRTRVELFKRTMPVTILYQTIVVFTMYLVISLVVSTLLMITESHSRPIDFLFETNSALGTVGLSTGVTSGLSDLGKSLLILTMYLGRVGPFTTALAIGRRQLTEQYRYPEERIQIG